ncbi:response regulator [Pseudoalteromonas sp. SG43-7]|uniref:response regulator n=1 Tax=Pseudoalteromonas sp. SG43-7 TaxID=2760966 RepID=UPI0015FFE839|nr:response regulator [Pseudoalteromonas sp. SG43-7]MBB1423100.1 response regulator [Pseudoalteromonas sp. SG43-7]
MTILLLAYNILQSSQITLSHFCLGTLAKLGVVSYTLTKQAVEAAKEKDFDLILMDIQMPEMDGVEAMKNIINFNKHIPIIALSANVMIDDVADYLSQGFDAHIAKPIDIATLYGVLSSFIK